MAFHYWVASVNITIFAMQLMDTIWSCVIQYHGEHRNTISSRRLKYSIPNILTPIQVSSSGEWWKGVMHRMILRKCSYTVSSAFHRSSHKQLWVSSYLATQVPTNFTGEVGLVNTTFHQKKKVNRTAVSIWTMFMPMQEDQCLWFY